MAKIDYAALFGAEEYDPCAALIALRPAYMETVAKGGVRTVKFRDRTVEFNATNIAEFGNLIRQLEADCAAKNGRGTARAIMAGFRRA